MNFYNARGFSLLEMLVVITITTVLLFLTITSFSNLLEQRRASFYTQTLKSALEFTRMQAIITGEPVQLHYHHSIRKLYISRASGKVLRWLPTIPRQDMLYLQISGNQPASHLVFKPNGLLDGHNGTFSYCPNHSNKNARALIFNKVGRARISPLAANGQKIRCNFRIK